MSTTITVKLQLVFFDIEKRVRICLRFRSTFKRAFRRVKIVVSFFRKFSDFTLIVCVRFSTEYCSCNPTKEV